MARQDARYSARVLAGVVCLITGVLTFSIFSTGPAPAREFDPLIHGLSGWKKIWENEEAEVHINPDFVRSEGDTRRVIVKVAPGRKKREMLLEKLKSYYQEIAGESGDTPEDWDLLVRHYIEVGSSYFQNFLVDCKKGEVYFLPERKPEGPFSVTVIVDTTEGGYGHALLRELCR